MRCAIYTLTNPTTGLIFYVGRSIQDLNKRLNHHCCELNSPKNPRSLKHEEINRIIKDGLLPIIEEIDFTYDKSTIPILEKYWIMQLKSWGFPITNREVNKNRRYDVLYTERFPYGVAVLMGEPEPTDFIFTVPFAKLKSKQDQINKLNQHTNNQ